MTTVAYKNGVIAADTRITNGGSIMGDATKVGRKVGKGGTVLYGSCGSLVMMQRFLDWVATGMKGEQPYMGNWDKEWAKGLVIHEDHALFFGPSGVNRLTGDFFAIGSGAEYAMGAMAAGATASAAIDIASQFDTGTGGYVIALGR